MSKSENIIDIAKALCAFQGQLKPVSKDSINPHFKSSFSSLSCIWEGIREPLSSNGLMALQNVLTKDKCVSVTTTILHVSGQWIEFGPLDIPLSKYDAHGIGSAISYGKRYALCAALGIVSGDEDDDGNKAVAKQEPKPKITQEQCEHLFSLFEQCEPKFVDSIMQGIYKIGFKNISEINTDVFGKICISTNNHINEIAKKQHHEAE